MTPMFRRYLVLLSLVCCLTPLAAWSDAYPSKSIRLVIPFSPGGATDVVARIVAQKLTEAFKQSVVVDSRPGANGIIGTDIVAKAAPDGYTLLASVASAHTLNPSIYKLPYDPLKDFVAVSLVANLPIMVVAHPSLPAKTIQEFIALAKSKPGQINFSSGTSLIQLTGELFKSATDTNIVAIPYKGTGPQLTAVLAGEVSLTFDPFTALSQVKAGKLRALAILAPKRSPLLPDVPTLEEAGVRGVDVASWVGILVPAGTPNEIVNRLQGEIAKIAAMPDVKERFASISYEPVGSTPEQFANLIRVELAKWAKVVKETNFKVE
ncbi:MAG: tripartite tricarboxylate transporter substrate binding protein [Betaproteobacteria bacterium]|nr:MAG: tripartite tricarboxylate transporter substrate binding protein [Betaproteobacteria bacterium]